MDKMETPTQLQHFDCSGRALAEKDRLMLSFLFGLNPLTDDELRRLIEKRPAVYGRYAGYLGRR